MTLIRNFPLFTIVLSLFSGVLCLVLKSRAARIYTCVYEAVLIVLTASVLWYTSVTGEAFTYTMGEFPAPWGNEIRAGVLEALIALVFLIVMLCSVLAGGRFLKEDLDDSKLNLYYTLVNLMTAALMAIVWTNDIFTGYVFLEILTLTSCGVLIVREIGRTTLAAIRYMILNLLGSGLFLLGIVLLYDITGHLLMVPMQETIALIAQDPSERVSVMIALGVMTLGIAIKSGLFPFHFWMPDTYGWATPISSSLLSSLVSKGYIFLLVKIIWRVIGIDVFYMLPLQRILFVLGILGMIMGSVSALRANNINRMIAFSSAAQIGYIYMGIGIGGHVGYTAALFHMIAHSVTKSTLFLTTPYLAAVSGNSLMFRNLAGSARRDRRAGFFFMLSSLSMIGIPMFAGFSSKLLFALAAMDHVTTRKLMLTMLALAASTLLNAMYFVRTLIRIYTENEGTGGGHVTVTEKMAQGEDTLPQSGNISFLLPVIVLTAINLFLGLSMHTVVDLIEKGFSMFG